MMGSRTQQALARSCSPRPGVGLPELPQPPRVGREARPSSPHSLPSPANQPRRQRFPRFPWTAEVVQRLSLVVGPGTPLREAVQKGPQIAGQPALGSSFHVQEGGRPSPSCRHLLRYLFIFHLFNKGLLDSHCVLGAEITAMKNQVKHSRLAITQRLKQHFCTRVELDPNFALTEGEGPRAAPLSTKGIPRELWPGHRGSFPPPSDTCNKEARSPEEASF